jgi:hypothetical protein
MLRSRIIKPEFFKHGALYDAECDHNLPLRLAFEGLWCVSDREGRFAWRPREMKLDILPYDDVDFADILDALEQAGFIRSYTVDGKRYGVIPSFSAHQTFHHREAASKLPPPPNSGGAEPSKGKAEPSASPVVAQGKPRSSPTVSVSVSDSISVSVGDGEEVPPRPPQTQVLDLELETLRRSYPKVADAITPTADGDLLIEFCRYLRNTGGPVATYIAEMGAALDGMHGYTAPPEALRVAVLDWMANREPPNLRKFRNYIRGAIPRPGSGVVTVQSTIDKIMAGLPKGATA